MSPFSPDYATARARFLAGGVGPRVPVWSRSRSAGPGRRARNSTIDVAVLGSARPERVLIVSSGLHGVEGFFGSAVQIALLESPTRARATARLTTPSSCSTH